MQRLRSSPRRLLYSEQLRSKFLLVVSTDDYKSIHPMFGSCRRGYEAEYLLQVMQGGYKANKLFRPLQVTPGMGLFDWVTGLA